MTECATRRPLAGTRVIVTRARAQAGALVELLEDAGAQVLVFPTIEIVDPESFDALDEAIRHLDTYSWVVFTSANTVERFFARLETVGTDARAVAGLEVAAVGPATAAALERHGVEAGFVPDEYVGEGLAAGLLERGVRDGTRVLLPRALEAREVLPTELGAHGAVVDVVVVYRTVKGSGDPAVLEAIRAGEADVVTFTSSSTVRSFIELTEGIDISRLVVACIGPVTSKTAREVGLTVSVEPEQYTIPALVEALAAHFG
jgi:uroporphyrinogen III methyltransferase/synthase